MSPSPEFLSARAPRRCPSSPGWWGDPEAAPRERRPSSLTYSLGRWRYTSTGARRPWCYLRLARTCARGTRVARLAAHALECTPDASRSACLPSRAVCVHPRSDGSSVVLGPSTAHPTSGPLSLHRHGGQLRPSDVLPAAPSRRPSGSRSTAASPRSACLPAAAPEAAAGSEARAARAVVRAAAVTEAAWAAAAAAAGSAPASEGPARCALS